MRPTKPFVALLHDDDMIHPVSVILPEETEPEEHEYEGFSFVVHHPIFTEGEMWVATERTTGQTLTNGTKFVTKDRAIENFKKRIDKGDHDKLHTDLMTALVNTQGALIMTTDEYVDAYCDEEPDWIG